jgi:hypothetical protein
MPPPCFSGETLRKRHPAAFLLLPVLLLIFAFGLLLYSGGKQQSNGKKASDKIKPVKPDAEENDVQIGAIAELEAQEQTVAQ